jgi:hypothetical protein
VATPPRTARRPRRHVCTSRCSSVHGRSPADLRRGRNVSIIETADAAPFSSDVLELLAARCAVGVQGKTPPRAPCRFTWRLLSGGPWHTSREGRMPSHLLNRHDAPHSRELHIYVIPANEGESMCMACSRSLSGDELRGDAARLERHGVRQSVAQADTRFPVSCVEHGRGSVKVLASIDRDLDAVERSNGTDRDHSCIRSVSARKAAATSGWRRCRPSDR